MILYKFLNEDKTESAKYITDSFYDVNEEKSLRQFYVTELREVSPAIVQAGVNIEIGMYTEVDFINMAKISQLTLEKWDDNTFIGTLVTIPVDVEMTVNSPAAPVKYGEDIEFDWEAVPDAKFYEIFAHPENKGVDFTSPTLTVVKGPISMKNTYLPGNVNFFFLVYMNDGTVKKSQVKTFASVEPAVTAKPAADATDVQTPVTLEWDAVEGAIDYLVYIVGDDEEFVPNEFNRVAGNRLSIELEAKTQYKWKVVANMGSTNMTIVASRNFTVA